MAVFHYVAMDVQGLERNGSLEAESERAAVNQLRVRSLYVVEIHDIATASKRAGTDAATLTGMLPVVTVHLMFFFRQMALMLRSGLTLLQSLETAAGISKNRRLTQIIRDLDKAVRQGAPLSEAMAAKGKGVFPVLAVKMIQSAELSGELELDRAMARIAEYLDRRAELRRNLFTSLMYPSIVVLSAIGVTGFMLTTIIPKMVKFLEHRGNALPPATQALVDVSAFVQNWGWLIVLLAVLVVVFMAVAYRSERGRPLMDRGFLAVPVVGKSLLLGSMTQFCWSMGMLLDSGVPVLESLRISAEITPNKAISTHLQKARDQVVRGHAVAASLAGGLIPDLTSQLAGVGERSGSLDRVMNELGNYFQGELQTQIKRMTAMIEPVLIGLVSGMVGFVYYALFQAIFALNKSVATS